MVCRRALHSMSEHFLVAVTGMTELERILTGASLTDIVFGPPVPTSITNSSLIRTVEKYLTRLPSSLSLENCLYSEQVTTHAATQQMCRTLRVQPRFSEVLQQVLKQIRAAKAATKLILREQKVAVDENATEHKQMLEELWSLLTGADVPASLDSQAWKEIGFQNPVKDFRGVGLLGLRNLLFFSRKHPGRAREVLQSSRSEELWLPFANTGLNITAWLLEFLEAGQLNIFFYCNPSDPLDTFHTVYAFVFLEFSRFWHIARPVDIMQFGQIAEKFKAQVHETLQGLTDAASHSEWGLNSNTGEDLVSELTCWIDGEVHPHDNPRLLQHVVRV